MDAVNYSNFRKHLKDYFKQVNDHSEPLIVTNKEPEDNVVVMSKQEYDSLVETLDIESNKYLMAKIRNGQKQVDANRAVHHELIDPDYEVDTDDIKLD
ncbi:type II toxin-antitoxin system Phd/YefM family antitoxin [Lactobacillus sp. ESL0731]|uniref:type II toxin-antitoxin system Phd/YefM family antitoxin n=1 Tax=unclassified Lactobacillus TaxID=2620435 RepID=UPI0023F92DD6|nr:MULTISPECIES: type II toxin-antitoxin system Phd/YefM family antitoxin [unclassified Lactobacillus]WEV51176.1 type II toxin-antitoxin system Phd/YefM family antitoxin [Lactobacillus sp. ESL0700]WEV62306.1 type II toxin-antitoxin system Phd/YefM family antitoxin [Lactobacillus sp. ESL0731]